MPTLPTAEWTAALESMNRTVVRTLAELDRYQATWSTAADGPPANHPDRLLASLESRLAGWDARLNSASELAAAVENDLADREAAVTRWQGQFLQWNQMDLNHKDKET